MPTTQLRDPETRLARRLAILAGLALFAAIAALAVSAVAWAKRELAAVEQLAAEARLLGGDAYIEGTPPLWERTIELVVDLHGPGLDDDGFARLERMPAFRHVRFLHLADTRIADRSLRLLAKCPRLLVLDLSRTKVTDAGLDALASLRSLSMLRLTGTTITDRGLETLERGKGKGERGHSCSLAQPE